MSMSNPKKDHPDLSIVIPIYNGKRYLRDTLKSVDSLSQLIGCEVIFQNALSSDGTAEIIDEFCAGRQNWRHYNEKDSGQSDAINRGVCRARGRWVTWLCADDIIMPSLSDAIREAEKIGTDVVYGDVVFFNEDTITPAIGTETCQPGSLAKRRLIIQQPGTCISRRVWKEGGRCGPKTELVNGLRSVFALGVQACAISSFEAICGYGQNPQRCQNQFRFDQEIA